MMIVLACYVGSALFLRSAQAPVWLQLFFYGAAVATGVASAITFKWKISAHTTAAGGLCGLVTWIALSNGGDALSMTVLSLVILLAGSIGTARLILNRHTLAQVIAGFALGCLCTLGLLFVFGYY